MNITGGTVIGFIYGGGLGATAVLTGSPAVSFTVTSATSVFDGGNQCDVTGSPIVTIGE